MTRALAKLAAAVSNDRSFSHQYLALARAAPLPLGAVLLGHAGTRDGAQIASSAVDAMTTLHARSLYGDSEYGALVGSAAGDAQATAALAASMPALVRAVEAHGTSNPQMAAAVGDLLVGAIMQSAVEATAVARAGGCRAVVAALEHARAAAGASGAALCLAQMAGAQMAPLAGKAAAAAVAALQRWQSDADAVSMCLSLLARLIQDAPTARAVAAAGAVPAVVRAARAHVEPTLALTGARSAAPSDKAFPIFVMLLKYPEAAPAVAQTPGVAAIAVDVLQRRGHGGRGGFARFAATTLAKLFGHDYRGLAEAPQLRSGGLVRAVPTGVVAALRVAPEDELMYINHLWDALDGIMKLDCKPQVYVDGRPAVVAAGPAARAAIDAGAPALMTAALRRGARDAGLGLAIDDAYSALCSAMSAAGHLACCLEGAAALLAAGALPLAVAALAQPSPLVLRLAVSACPLVTAATMQGKPGAWVAAFTGGGAPGGLRASLFAAILRVTRCYMRDDPSIALAACHVAGAVACHSPAAARLAVSIGAPELIVAMLDTYGAADPGLAEDGCRVLRDLARFGRGASGRAVEAPLADRIVRAGGFRAVAAVLRRWAGVDGEVVNVAKAALDALSAGGGELARAAAREAGYAVKRK